MGGGGEWIMCLRHCHDISLTLEGAEVRCDGGWSVTTLK